jgi:hypothetical protein
MAAVGLDLLRPATWVSCQEPFLGVPLPTIEPANDARREVPWSGRSAVRQKWVGNDFC